MRPKVIVATTFGVALAVALAIGVLSTGTAMSDSSCPAGPRQAPIIHRGAGLRPPSQSPAVPLVIGLHGSGQSPAGFEQQSGLDQVADRDGFVVAYLGSQTPASGSAWALCNMPSNLSYISTEIAQLITTQNIDPSRVDVTGFSAGASMTFYVGCSLSSQVAAIAPVSGWMQIGQPCHLARPESMMLIMGTNDAVSVNGTATLLSASGMASLWEGLNGCNRSPSVAVTNGRVNEAVWNRCDDSSAVGLDIVQGGTHQWPPADGAGAALNASQAISGFFSAHPAMSATMPSVVVTSVAVRHVRARRWVRTGVSVAEGSVGMAETLRYHGRRVASRGLDPSRGRHIAILALPRTAAAGRYTLTLAFSDRYGRRTTIARTVRVPSVRRSKRHAVNHRR